jgi:hypothetical protein
LYIPEDEASKILKQIVARNKIQNGHLIQDGCQK